MEEKEETKTLFIRLNKRWTAVGRLLFLVINRLAL
jgi:hypothetical protein